MLTSETYLYRVRRMVLVCVATWLLIFGATNAAESWSQTQTFTASDAAAGNHFGRAVALGGNTAVVSAFQYLGNGPGGGNAGAAYVFQANSAGTWTEQAKLAQTDRPDGNRFGWTVGVSGSAAIVGAPGDGSSLFDSTGAAYVFGRDSAGYWTQLVKLQPAPDANVAFFGDSVDISGNVAIVGAPVGGTAFLYRDNGAGYWSEFARLTGDVEKTAYFGDAVAVDGNTAIVGASDATARFAQIYRDDGTGHWNKIATLTGSGGPVGHYGEGVDISGKTAIVGSVTNSERAVYIYQEDEHGIWNQAFNFTFLVHLAEDYDKIVSISDHVAIANSGFDGDTYVFRETEQGWGLDSVLHRQGAGYGWGGAVDHGTMLLGAMYDDAGAIDTGRAYFFQAVPEPSGVMLISAAAMIALPSVRSRFPTRIHAAG